MKGRQKTKEQLMRELSELRQRTSTLEALEAERQRLQEALIRSESELRATLYGIGDAVISTDPAGRVVMMNPVAEHLTGWGESEVRGRPLEEVFRIVNEETHREVENPVARVLREGIVVGLANHTLLIARDGTEHPIMDSGAPIRDRDGKVVGVVLVFRDQTEERRAQRMVAEARIFAENIVATVREPLVVLDANLRVLFANRSFYRTFQETPETTEGRLLYELGNHQWNIPQLRELLEDILPQNTSFEDFEVEHDFFHIGRRTILLNARRVHRQANKTEVILLAIEDITERKRAQEALRESEARYRAVVEQSADGIYLVDVETRRVIEANRAFARMLGHSPEEILAVSIYDFINAERRDIDERFQYILEREDPFAYERQYRRRDGLLLDVWVSVHVISYRGRKVMCTIARDITDRKRAQEALRESEERYRTIMEQSPDGIFLVDAESRRVMESNRAFQQLLGYTTEELRNLMLYDLIAAPPEDINARFQEARKQKNPLTLERRYRRKEGSLCDVWVSAQFISYYGKEVMCVLIRDITERKRAEKALQESEERYRAIMEQSADGIYLVDADTERIIEANRALAQMLGYTQEEMRGMHNYQLVAAAPADISRRFQEILTSPSPLSFERRFRKKDGSLLEVWITAGVLFFAGKRAACGIIKDLTERKRAEQEREKLIAELQEALDNIKTLRGLVPICANCKKIRDDKGYWQQVEVYVHDHSEAKFSHGLCPECTKLFFPGYEKKNEGGNPA